MPSQKLKNYLYKNYGDLNFKNDIDDWGLNQPSFSHGASYVDLDNDGDLDLVVSNVNDKPFIYKKENQIQNMANRLMVISQIHWEKH